MFYGIIDDNKKFILLDSDQDKLRSTALMLAKEIEVEITDFDENENIIGSHTEKTIVPMFDENTVDEAIKEYADEDIETAYTGDKYLQGYAPKPSNEEQSEKRRLAYIAESDPISAHISYLQRKEQTPEIVAEIAQLEAEQEEIRNAIKERFPYYE